MLRFDHFQLEFEAHIWWFCSTDENSFGAEYELQTPRGSVEPDVMSLQSCTMYIFRVRFSNFSTTIKKPLLE